MLNNSLSGIQPDRIERLEGRVQDRFGLDIPSDRESDHGGGD